MEAGDLAASPCIGDPLRGKSSFGSPPKATPCISPACTSHCSSITCCGLPNFFCRKYFLFATIQKNEEISFSDNLLFSPPKAAFRRHFQRYEHSRFGDGDFARSLKCNSSQYEYCRYDRHVDDCKHDDFFRKRSSHSFLSQWDDAKNNHDSRK